jgi:hypothetical protein
MRYARILARLALVGGFLLTDPLAAQATPAAGQSLAPRLQEDLRAALVAPLDFDRADWKRIGLGLAAIGAAAAIEEELQEAAVRLSTPATHRFTQSLRPLGQEGGLALLGATWLAGGLCERPRLQRFAEDGLEAVLLASGVAVPALKSLTGRERPRADGGVAEFFRGGQSFPSGESAQAFALAAVVSSYSRSRWVRGTAWSLAGALAVGRIEADGHWASDVVAGALIGGALGHWVAARHGFGRGPLRNLEVAPIAGEDGAGFGVRLSW